MEAVDCDREYLGLSSAFQNPMQYIQSVLAEVCFCSRHTAEQLWLAHGIQHARSRTVTDKKRGPFQLGLSHSCYVLFQASTVSEVLGGKVA